MKLKHFSLVLILCTLQFDSFSQQYSIGLNTSFQWFTSDFYLNYEAVENPDLKVTYGDGSVKNVVEQYEFSPLWSIIPTFTYKVKNPRRKGSSLSYTMGIGYAQTSFVIDIPVTVWYNPKGYALSAGDARDFIYQLGYVAIPLEISKDLTSMRKVIYGSVGVEVNNYILASKYGYEQLYGQSNRDEIQDERLASVRDYWVSLGLKPTIGVRLGRDRQYKIGLSALLGATPFNLLKDPLLFSQAGNYESENIKAYEEANSLNLYYGVGLSFTYQFD